MKVSILYSCDKDPTEIQIVYNEMDILPSPGDFIRVTSDEDVFEYCKVSSLSWDVTDEAAPCAVLRVKKIENPFGK